MVFVVKKNIKIFDEREKEMNEIKVYVAKEVDERIRQLEEGNEILKQEIEQLKERNRQLQEAVKDCCYMFKWCNDKYRHLSIWIK